MTEIQLIDRARQGDVRAERALYEAHVDRVFRLAYRLVGDRGLAEDLTQEAFVKAFANLDHFRGEAALADLARHHHQPPPTPRERMWDRIQSARHEERRTTTLAWWRRPAARWSSAVAAFSDRARDLLGLTRLLLDSPAAQDPELSPLLGDLELSLTRLVRLADRQPAVGRDDLEHGLSSQALLPRLRQHLSSNPAPVGL